MDYIPTIGLMSGTSMDGIDVSFTYTNGSKLKRTKFSLIHPYKKKTKLTLSNLALNMVNNQYQNNDFKDLSRQITIEHAEAISRIISIIPSKPDLIGFHGQTIYHNSSERISIQLGDPLLLSELTKTKVVFNFRKNDLINGGQGAPLAPIYHKAIMENLNLEIPCCFLNIGGVSNLTFWDNHSLVGFDTGPGNGLIDQYMQTVYEKDYDFNGEIAFKGIADFAFVKKVLEEKFFYKKPPKSLDRLDFNHIFHDKSFLKLKPSDAITTLSQITIQSIKKGINQLIDTPSKIIIMGGGEKNKYILNQLKIIFPNKVFTSQEIDLPGEFIEAELMAFLAVRRFYKMPSSFNSTTGVSKNMILGDIIYPKSAL